MKFGSKVRTGSRSGIAASRAAGRTAGATVAAGAAVGRRVPGAGSRAAAPVTVSPAGSRKGAAVLGTRTRPVGTRARAGGARRTRTSGNTAGDRADTVRITDIPTIITGSTRRIGADRSRLVDLQLDKELPPRACGLYGIFNVILG